MNGKTFNDASGPGRAARPSVEIDIARYQGYLDDTSLDDDQKEEMIKALWVIMTAFVDLGFGVHPAQEVCGQVPELVADEADTDSNKIKPDTLNETFNALARAP